MIDRQALAEAGFTSDDAGTTWKAKLPTSGDEIKIQVFGEDILPPLVSRRFQINGHKLSLLFDGRATAVAEIISLFDSLDITVNATGHERHFPLPAGSTVKIGGIPYRLVAATTVAGTQKPD